MLVIFDLDHTLMHAVMRRDGTLLVSSRPWARDMLLFLFKYFDVGIWTAACREYAIEVLRIVVGEENLNKFQFIYTREKCIKLKETNQYIKPLHKIWRISMAKRKGWNRKNTIIVEDTQDTCIKNYGNAVYVPKFLTGQNNDPVLVYLCPYLFKLATEEDVRIVEKRNWLFGL